MKQKPYRLNSLEEPTDEQLNELMDQVGVAIRESCKRVAEEKERRMQEVRDALAAYRKGITPSP